MLRWHFSVNKLFKTSLPIPTFPTWPGCTFHSGSSYIRDSPSFTTQVRVRQVGLMDECVCVVWSWSVLQVLMRVSIPRCLPTFSLPENRVAHRCGKLVRQSQKTTSVGPLFEGSFQIQTGLVVLQFPQQTGLILVPRYNG